MIGEEFCLLVPRIPHIIQRPLYQIWTCEFLLHLQLRVQGLCREWNEIRPLAFAVALLGMMVFLHGPSMSINTRVIVIAHTLFKGYENQGITKYYPIALIILSDMYRALGKCKEGHR